MTIFEYQDYKQYVNDWLASLPRKGHGQLRKMATYIRVNSVVMSQVFRGDRDLTLEQAAEVIEFIGLTPLERNYFLLLVHKQRAGTMALRKVYEEQIVEFHKKASAIKNHVIHEKLNEESRATFYSQWYYSAIRLGVSIPELNTAEAIADELKLSRALVMKVFEFLVKHGLVTEKQKKYTLGPSVTHVGHDSPYVNRHHANWRLKGLQAMDSFDEEQLFYTGPMALSEKAAQKIRKELIELVGSATKIASQSESETLRCLNLDWFLVSKKK